MIVVCGEALVDFTATDVDGEMAYLPRPGGSPHNVAVGLARLGVPCAFLGKISTDAFGEMLAANLAANGVALRYAARSDLPSALAFVLPENEGGHSFRFYGDGAADQDLSSDDIPDELASALSEVTEAVHFGSYSMVLGRTGSTLRRFMRRVRGQVVVSLDPNVRPSLLPHREAYVRRLEGLVPYANLVKVSEQDLAWLFPDTPAEEIAFRWLDVGPDVVVVTRGEHGAVGYANYPKTIEIHVPGIQVDVVDTVGAGDAFTSGLLARLSRKGQLSPAGLAAITEAQLLDAMTYANRAAALTCARAGASPPSAGELLEWV